MPGGRPAKTLEDFNLPDNWKEIIYELSAKGQSEVQIRAHFLMLGGKFSQKTWDALKKREEEFLLTIKQAKVLCEKWWLDIAQKNLEHHKDRKFETACWFINMKNRFGWSDKQEVEHSGDVKFTVEEAHKKVREYEEIRQDSSRFTLSVN